MSTKPTKKKKTQGSSSSKKKAEKASSTGAKTEAAAGSSSKAAASKATAVEKKSEEKKGIFKKSDDKKAASKKQDSKKAAAKKDDKKNGKPGIIARAKAYLFSVKTEMKRVVWPSKKELVNYSVAVCISLVVVGVAIAILDAIISGGLLLLSGLRG